MQIRHMPNLNMRYWLSAILMGCFATSIVQYYTVRLAWSGLSSTGIVIILFGSAQLLENRDIAVRESYYWISLLLVSLAASLVFHSLPPTFPPVTAAVGSIIALALSAWVNYLNRGPRAAFTERTRGLPYTGWPYWIAMLAAHVAGSSLAISSGIKFREGITLILTGAICLVLLALPGSRDRSVHVLRYWATSLAARAFGVGLAGFLIGDSMIDLGPGLSALVSAAGLIFVLVAWPQSTDWNRGTYF